MNPRVASLYSFLAITVLTALAVLAAAVGWLPSAQPDLVKWGLPVVLAEIVATVVAYVRTGSDASRAARVLRGAWWQYVFGTIHHPVTFLRVSFAPDGRLLLDGTACDGEGHPVATWTGENAAFNPSNRQLFYFWEGTDHVEQRTLSGVGVFQFEARDGDGVGEAAEGWFTRGDILQAARKTAVRDIQQVALRRATPDEARVLDGSDSAARARLIASRYEAFRREWGIAPTGEPPAATPL